MPKILIFAPCEKVIVSEEDKTTSLISLIEGFTIGIPEGTEVPEEATIPIKWHVLTIWEKIEGEDEKRFEQRIELVLPDGKKPLDEATAIDFKPEPKRFRQVSMIIGFPISPSGSVMLKLSLKEVGQSDWQEVAEYAIFITRPQATAEEGVTNEEPKPENAEVG
ncbi:MAG: hypothetical protein H0T45_07465 [Pyrinomonadaceae bacterium]|nr:hypothetical protein [Pyrinomonadaceae bacterium]